MSRVVRLDRRKSNYVLPVVFKFCHSEIWSLWRLEIGVQINNEAVFPLSASIYYIDHITCYGLPIRYFQSSQCFSREALHWTGSKFGWRFAGPAITARNSARLYFTFIIRLQLLRNERVRELELALVTYVPRNIIRINDTDSPLVSVLYFYGLFVLLLLVPLYIPVRTLTMSFVLRWESRCNLQVRKRLIFFFGLRDGREFPFVLNFRSLS